MNKQLSYAPAEIDINFNNGGWAAYYQSKTLLNRQIMLLCYENPKSIEELSEILEVAGEYIYDAVSGMAKDKLLSEEDGKYYTTFPMFSKYEIRKAKLESNKAILEAGLPKKFDELLDSLKDRIISVDFYGNNFNWKYLKWVIYKFASDRLGNLLQQVYIQKTDEVVIDRNSMSTQNYSYGVIGEYKYADDTIYEQMEDVKETLTFYTWSFYDFSVQDYGWVQRVFMDAKPFPASWGWEDNKYHPEKSRGDYIKISDVSLIFQLIENPAKALNENEKKAAEEMLSHGVLNEVIIDGKKAYKPAIPVFNKKAVQEINIILEEALKPVALEFAKTICERIEKILLPSMYGRKERLAQFYIYWLDCYFGPTKEFFWYGINKDGFEIPMDYSKSSAAMYLLKE